MPSLRVTAFLFVLALILSAVPVAGQTPPTVQNVSAVQQPNSFIVEITYDLIDPDPDPLQVIILVSPNGGQTFPIEVKTTTGTPDIGSVLPGTGKQVLWDARADYPDRAGANFVARVVAVDPVYSDMVLVPPGEFWMGYGNSGYYDYGPKHLVYLDAYLIDKHEVTNAQFCSFLNDGNDAYYRVEMRIQYSGGTYEPTPGFAWHPVHHVTWNAANAYAQWAGKRLPTDAEWEKAVRGTDERIYPWGATITGENANYGSSGDPYEDDAYSQTTPIGFYDGRVEEGFATIDSPSFYGIYDAAGNIEEWTNDWAWNYPDERQVNPQGPPDGTSKILRGGSWAQNTNGCLSYERRWLDPTGAYSHIGFRCAKSITDF